MSRKSGPKPKSLCQRFLSKIELSPDSSCWLWSGYLKPNGYASMYVNDSARKEYAHRVAYELFKCPIPDGMDIDHLCRVRHCVNPDHLEAVTRKVNVGRSPIMGNPRNKNATHCIRGHELSGENLYVKPNGRRICRTCRRLRQKARKEAESLSA